MPAGHTACPTWRRPRGKTRTYCTEYMSWKPLDAPQEELEKVTAGEGVWRQGGVGIGWMVSWMGEEIIWIFLFPYKGSKSNIHPSIHLSIYHLFAYYCVFHLSVFSSFDLFPNISSPGTYPSIHPLSVMNDFTLDCSTPRESKSHHLNSSTIYLMVSVFLIIQVLPQHTHITTFSICRTQS